MLVITLSGFFHTVGSLSWFFQSKICSSFLPYDITLIMHSCNQHFQTKQKLYHSWEISMKFLVLLNHFPKISLLSLPHNILYQSSIHLSLIFSYSIVIWSLITICEKGLTGYMLLLSCLKICLTEFNRFYQCHKFMNRVREWLLIPLLFSVTIIIFYAILLKD